MVGPIFCLCDIFSFLYIQKILKTKNNDFLMKRSQDYKKKRLKQI